MADRELIQTGTFGRAHGVRGEIRYFPVNPGSDLFEVGSRVFARRGDQDFPLTVARARRANKFDIVQFDEVADRDEAEALTNLEVFVDAEVLPELEEDEFYQKDLVEREVLILLAEEGPSRSIGEVGGFFETGANDVMVVHMSDGSKLFVPMIEDAVADLDHDGAVLLQPLDHWAPEGTELP
ncbi:16S rRNA processing protein RimM [Persicimonas caeni]|uniref:Ribosome maturation factor RimM n=1 Tax=Persicimonas caeni TaxID=2292766 RepID=A0A4Y6PNV5_PERCE|nr:ribosome maturation factor RimM [Persicimonas caeni]QDG49984.1 16S rRNA processing protein RimM [Persicimonas caeni]QED31205.1 16S rRNA processing protein RimM [Persicimonas caeni]